MRGHDLSACTVVMNDCTGCMRISPHLNLVKFSASFYLFVCFFHERQISVVLFYYFAKKSKKENVAARCNYHTG